MVDSYKILYKGGLRELVERRSRSIADLYPVASEEEALEYIEEIRRKYWDARHHRFAYIIGDREQSARCSDDGEPSQTAGKPMMGVLAGKELHDVCAVVARHFGGTLLGTGGLVRAYSGAVREGTKNCVILEKKLAAHLNITTDYSGAEKIQYIAAQGGIDTLDTWYTDKAVLTFLVPIAEERKSTAQTTGGTAGKVVTQRVDEVYHGLGDNGLVVFQEECGNGDGNEETGVWNHEVSRVRSGGPGGGGFGAGLSDGGYLYGKGVYLF